MKRLLPWIAVLAIVWVTFGTVYVAVQQAQRSEANSPQIQMAQDAAAGLNAGDFPPTQVGQNVDMAKSLAPFTIIYDKNGKVVAGSGYLNGKVPAAPIGVLKASDGQDYHAVTWEPQNGVRIATVTTSSNKYYVLSGRNLKEVEKNENLVLQITVIGGLAATCLLGMVYGLSIILRED